MTYGVLLFHLSDTLQTEFKSLNGKRPVFYWFNDKYHSHVYGDMPGATYMYFFVVKPKENNAKLFTRHSKGDFKSMWTDYSEYLKIRTDNESKGITNYLEPGIVYSFSEMVPLVVGKFTDGFNLWAKTIDETQEAEFNLGSKGNFRRFDEIPELVALLPDLVNTVPIVHPSEKELSDPSTFWPADTENEGRFWL